MQRTALRIAISFFSALRALEQAGAADTRCVE